MQQDIFDEYFFRELKAQIDLHHSLYPRTPPQGIFFECLVDNAMTALKRKVEVPGMNFSGRDMTISGIRTSLKTETGVSTKPDKITITKLCTTEKEPWEPDHLKHHVLEHLSRYEEILMLRSLHRPDRFIYQLVNIPIPLLTRIKDASFTNVGHRVRRKSLGADIEVDGQPGYRIHFDGSDGKCQIRNLQMSLCQKLFEWMVVKSSRP